MSAGIPGGLPCEPCMTTKIFGKPGEEHPCTGSAASPADGPCPCCPPVPMPKFCARRDNPIRPGEEWEPRDVITPTGPGGGTFYLHKKLCHS